MLAYRYAAAVVDDDHGVVLADRHVDRGRVARHRLVDGVVDDLPHEVMESPLIRGPDVHARPPPDGLQSLEDLDAGRRVIGPSPCFPAPRARSDGARFSRLVCHAAPP